MRIIIKTPTAYAFHVWITNYPESFHPNDMERFYTFVKTALRYKAKTWLDTSKLKIRILEYCPNFGNENLNYFLELTRTLVEFSMTPQLNTYSFEFKDKPEQRNKVKTIRIKNCKVEEKLESLIDHKIIEKAEKI